MYLGAVVGSVLNVTLYVWPLLCLSTVNPNLLIICKRALLRQLIPINFVIFVKNFFVA